jgi:hypothetical protein
MLGTHGLSLMVYGADGGVGTTDAIHDAADGSLSFHQPYLRLLICYSYVWLSFRFDCHSGA